MMIKRTLEDFLNTIAKITNETIRTDLFEFEVIETGGSIMRPFRQGDQSPETHMYEITLHSIYATGKTMIQAMGNWLKIAHSTTGDSTDGARAAATTHDETTRARTLAADGTPTFHCPLWPGCNCPGGTMRPECPGLKSRIGVK